jgi:hypothetical protein
MSLILSRQQVPSGGGETVTIGGVLLQEPIFPIRGRDLLALPTIDEYLKLCIALRLEKQHSVRRAIREIEVWQGSNPSGMVGNDHKHMNVTDQY